MPTLPAAKKLQAKETLLDDSIGKLLDELQFRQIYEWLDASTLAAIPDDKVELAIVDYVHTQLDGRDEAEAVAVARLPEGVQALYVTWAVEIEVIDGGFTGYYGKPAARFADAAVAAFEFFSAHQHANLMREANRVRAGQNAAAGGPKDQGTSATFPEPYREVCALRPLDERFYELEESLSALRIAKIRSHPSLFCGGSHAVR